MIQFLRKYLGISDLEDRIQDLETRTDIISEDLDHIAEKYVSSSDLQDKIERIQEDLNDLKEDSSERSDKLSPSEKRIVRLFLSAETYLSVKQIAGKLDKSPGTVRKYISMLRNKIPLKEIKEGRKKKYKITEEKEKEILSGTQSIVK